MTKIFYLLAIASIAVAACGGGPLNSKACANHPVDWCGAGKHCVIIGNQSMCAPVDASTEDTPRSDRISADTLDSGATDADASAQDVVAETAPDGLRDAVEVPDSALAPNGATCGANTACASGFCVDGYCCDKACTGQCEACDNPGITGTCKAARGAPHHAAAPARAVCGGDPACGGQCDGTEATKCIYPANRCRSASCSNGLQINEAFCNPSGVCPAVSTKTCQFVCVPGTGMCGGECSPGAKGCDGASPQMCDAEGTWQKQAACTVAPPGGTPLCAKGACDFSCNNGEMQCGGNCVDAQTDNANCGICGNTCSSIQKCVTGICKVFDGYSCATSAVCLSGYCGVDGVCCNTVTGSCAPSL